MPLFRPTLYRRKNRREDTAVSPLSVVVLSIIHNSLKATYDRLPRRHWPSENMPSMQVGLNPPLQSNSPPRGCAFTRVLLVPGSS